MHRSLAVPLLFLLATTIIAIGILAYTPPVSRDALTQHLVIPKLYIGKGAIYNIPELPSSYNPMNLDLLYAIPLYLGNDILAKYIHFGFALMASWLLFGYLKRRIGKVYASIGALFFLSIPIIVRLSITVYVDLGLIFFSTAALLNLFKWGQSSFNTRYLLLSAAYCGLAMGTKYNGLIVFLLLTLMVPWLYEQRADIASGKSIRAARHALTFGLLAVAVFSPWMIRDAIWTGNPVYPLFDSFFNANQVHTPVLGHFAVRKMVFHESWWQIMLMPVRLFFEGRDGDPQFFDGTLNAALFILPWFAFLRVRDETETFRTEKKILLSFSILFLLFAFLQTDLRARYVGPIIPPLVILSVSGIRNLVAAVANHVADIYQRAVVAAALPTLLTAILVPNVSYLVGQFEIVKPLEYLSGKLDRNAYIQKFQPEYAADRFINSNLRKDATVLAFFLGHRAYYLDRTVTFNTTPFLHTFQQQEPDGQTLRVLRHQNVTHFLVRLDLFETWTNNNLDSTSLEKLRQFMHQHTTRLFSQDGFAVFALIEPS